MLIFLLLFSNAIFGKADDHKHHQHAENNYELGLSLGLVHLANENENSLNTHVHFLKRLGSENIYDRIFLGLGLEYIFSKHKHYSLVGTISINPILAFIFDISPGIIVIEHDGSNKIQFVTHLELTYEFEYKNFGFGPVIGIGLSNDDRHYAIGIHIGKGF